MKPALAMTEAELMAAIRQLARLTGWRCYHTRYSLGSDPGFPDLVLVRLGRMVVAELKGPRGRLTPAQQEWLDALVEVEGRTGGVVEVHLWTPEDWACGAIEETLR